MLRLFLLKQQEDVLISSEVYEAINIYGFGANDPYICFSVVKDQMICT